MFKNSSPDEVTIQMVKNISKEKNKTFSVTINTYYLTVPFSNILTL